MKQDLKPRTHNQNTKIAKEEFMKRFHKIFCDPHFDPFRANLDEISNVAWDNYVEGRKAPSTSKAGENYADPDYELSKDWLEARAAILEAEVIHNDPTSPTNILLVIASDRNEGTCPGEYSKTSRLAEIAEKTLKSQSLEVEVLDLSRMTAEYGKMIYPCKACVSTAMPLCHWPCSCYPNHALGQANDWMNEIYPKWVRAHGIMIITPVYWHQAPSCLKLMMDRLVCADGGNDDPTTTQGKKAELAKKIELEGWHFPRHLKDRIFSVIVHGDTVGVDTVETALVEWLEDMKLIPAPPSSQLSRYIGYYEPYATSHEALDKDYDLMKEVHNAAIGLAYATRHMRSGGMKNYLPDLSEPRPK